MGNFRFGEGDGSVKSRMGCKEAAGDTTAFEILDIEIDRGCDMCYTTAAPIPLYKYNEIPFFLRDNPYVMDGYRSMLPFSVCLKSMFNWNNETVNIWSHLLGFFLFLMLMIWDFAVFLPDVHGTFSDYVILTIGLVSFQFCMLCSAGYHLFKCHSERASHRWLALDLTGISVGLLGLYLPGVHYAFYCLSIWRDIYLVIIVCLFGAVFVLQTNVKYLSDGWFGRRLLLYIALCAYGIIPSLHWVFLNGGLRSEIVQTFLPKVGVVYFLGLVAFAFYISKFPERCCPGKFDYAGSSHQWWHIMVVVTFYWWYRSGIEMLVFRHENPCTE